jgi:RNA ligase
MKKMINIELLKKNIADGYVISQKHPLLDLTIYNYSQFAQYDNHWDEITLMCRGLILDSEYNIIQRPFGKFFNKDEHVSEFKPDIPNLPFEVYDKMDGSLGIMYFDEMGTPFIASRGSFTSEQALMGTEMLWSKYRHIFGLLDRSKTYVFEIIYPENRIVVDYGDREALVLLAIIDTATGEDISLDTVSTNDFHVVERFNGITDFEKLQALDIDNKEGFVIRFENGFRMKLKFDEYCRLHRIITNITSYDIWECLRFGTGFDEMLDKVPDEFYDWVKATKKNLENEFTKIETYYREYYNEYGSLHKTQKEFAVWAKTFEMPGLMFNLQKGEHNGKKRFDDQIWKMIKPKYEKPFSSK